MTFRIDPIRPDGPAQRSGKTASNAAAYGLEEIENLPVPAGPARTVPRAPRRDPDATFAAHLLGQEGQKRGLRAGPGLIDAARQLYNRVEWSGAHDRRSHKGRAAAAVV